MGLTHHWRRPIELPTDAFRAAVTDCRTLLGPAPGLAGFDGTGQPILDGERIVFNGSAPSACEAFEVAAVEFDRRGRSEVWSFCKTEHLPYDLFVKAVLIVLHHHLQPHFLVTSDAPAQEWADAVALVQDRLGYGRLFEPSLE